MEIVHITFSVKSKASPPLSSLRTMHRYQPTLQNALSRCVCYLYNAQRYGTVTENIDFAYP